MNHQRLKKIKKIGRKMPGIALVKVFYDWWREFKLQSRIKRFLSNELPFVDSAPPSYGVGYEPTIRCNLKCAMCYQGQTRALRQSELSSEEVLDVFKKLEPKTKEIKLVGGEPFVRSDILDLIAFWDNVGKRVILQTNCTLINENNIKILKKYKNVTDILTSLDGPQKTHDLIRGVPGAFEKLKKAIQLIKKETPHISITVSGVLLPAHNLDQLFALVDSVKDLGLGTINIVFEQVYSRVDVDNAHKIFKNLFGWDEDSYRLNTQIRDPAFPPDLNAKKLKKALFKLRMYGLKRGCFVNFLPFNYYKNVDGYLGERPTRVFCTKLLAPELRINQKGQVIWCDVIEKSFGSLLEKTPDEIWLSDEYQKFRKYLYKGGLPICHRCCKAQYI